MFCFCLHSLAFTAKVNKPSKGQLASGHNSTTQAPANFLFFGFFFSVLKVKLWICCLVCDIRSVHVPENELIKADWFLKK